MFLPPSEHLAGLNWSEIRRAFEVDGVSVRALAARYGIASRNTIRRRIAKEGWTAPGGAEPEPAFVQYAPPEPPERQPVHDDPAVTMIPLAQLVAERALHATAAEIQADDPDADVLDTNELAALHTSGSRRSSIPAIASPKRVCGCSISSIGCSTTTSTTRTAPCRRSSRCAS